MADATTPAKSGDPVVRPWSAVLHSALGVLLGVYALFHAVQNYPAVDHADAWTERALTRSLGFGFGLLSLGVLVPHAILGAASWLRHRRAAARDSIPNDWGLRFQLVTGLLVLGFITFHVLQLWPSGDGPHGSVREPYAKMWQELGRPLPFVVYIAGVTAVAFHFGHGLSRLLVRTLPFVPAAVARAIAGILGFVLFLMFVQIVARFALGEALIPFLS